MAIASSAYEEALEGNQQPKEVLVKTGRITKQFDEILAVNTMSLAINKGEIFALLGDSGSGKSTLLCMPASFERPTEGWIFLDGQDIAGLPPYERPINMMFRSYVLFPHTSVTQSIAFGLRQDGLPKAEIDERVVEMLKLVHTARYAKHKPYQLSGDQRQRVVLAHSPTKRPKLLLLNKPIGALDKKLRPQMQLELVEIIECVGVTRVMVTHDQEETMTMAQRITITHLGYIEQVGDPMGIHEAPASRLVCEFIGNVDLFDDVLVEDVQDHTVIVCPQLENLVCIGHDISTRAEDKRITYALRPEKVMISAQKPDNLGHTGHSWARGTVYDIAYLGGHSVYYTKLVSGMIVQAFMASAERHVARSTWDQSVYIGWYDDNDVVLQSWNLPAA